MDSREWSRIKDHFGECLDLPRAERAAFLANLDSGIAASIARLIASHEAAGAFIEEPAAVGLGMASDADDANIGRRIDAYLILERIGTGGMGAVYLAEQQAEGLKHRVALKLIKRGMDTEAVLKRFVRERQILAELEHPNIARFLDGGSTSDGVPYLVMEYVTGLPIRKYCRDQARPIGDVLQLFRKVCSAVSFAHQNLIVHRDLKPSNILVTSQGEPKLLDFGIAKLLDPEHDDAVEPTATLQRIMTPEYAAPEQLDGETMTTASDIYSLGIILHELLTGRRPFDGRSGNGSASADRSSRREPKRPSYIDGIRNNADSSNLFGGRLLRGDLDNIILKALQVDPARRYSTVQEFSEDIRRHLAGLPVIATADTLRYRVGKFVSRHRVGVLAAAVVVVSLVGGTSVATWQWSVANRERDRANARFAKLRETARDLMTETRDALDYLPGTIKLRESLSAKSVGLLDSFYEDNSTDPEFLKELADAYEKLGRTDLWEFRQLSAAEKNISRAVEIRRRAFELDAAPERKSQLASTLSSLEEVAYFARDAGLLNSAASEHEQLLREIVGVDPSADNKSNLAQHLMGFVGTYKEFHLIEDNPRELREAYVLLDEAVSERLRREDLSPPRKTALVWDLICQGGLLMTPHKSEDSIPKFELASKYAREAYTADRSLQSAFNYNGFAHRMAGEALAERRRFPEALAMYQYSLDWVALRASDEGQSKPNLAWARSNSANRVAVVLDDLGREREAEQTIGEPWRVYSGFLDTETNAASVVYAEEPLKWLTTHLARSNRHDDAIEILSKHAARIQRFLDKNPADVDFLMRRAKVEAKIAELLSVSADFAHGADEIDRRRRARAGYEKAASTIAAAAVADGTRKPAEVQLAQDLERILSVEQPAALTSIR